MGSPDKSLIEFRLDDISKDVKQVLDILNDQERGLVIRTDRLEQKSRRNDKTTWMIVTAIVGGVVTFVCDLLRR